MATAVGFWMTSGFPAPRKARSPEPKKQRNYNYTFGVDDNGLDINGFILQTDKHKGKKQKFRVYLDSNENGRFDKNDQLIVRSGLKQKHAAKGIGNLLDEDELGQLEVKFKKPKSNASMKNPEIPIVGIPYPPLLNSMAFINSDDIIVPPTPIFCVVSTNC